MLLSCAGRRNYLAGYFREALGRDGAVYTADLSPRSAAMIEAGRRALVVPAVADPRYFEVLLERCREAKVRLLISLNDFELPGLAREAPRLRAAGVIPVVSSPEIVDLCFDKWATFRRLRELKVPAPETALGLGAGLAALSAGRLRYPVFVKPRWGTASVCVEPVRDEAELSLAYGFVSMKLRRHALGTVGEPPLEEKILVQQALTGPEFGVDIVNDLEGRHHAVIVRRKLAMRAGETDRAVTERNDGIAALARRVGESLGHIGLMDCDAFSTPDGPAILELNPRFGGGYPFSHVAGANVPAALLAWARGRRVKAEWLRARAGIISAKCDRLVVGRTSAR